MSPNRLARLALAAAVVFGALPASAQQDPFALPAGFMTQAAFSCGNVTVSGSAVVTSAGAGGEGHVVSNGNITLNGSSKIRGNASAGPGKTIKTTGSSQITGTRSYLDAAWACSPIDLAALGQALATTNDNVRIPKTSGGKNPLSGSSPPDLTLSGSETLVLPAGTYYFGKITIGGSSVLSVSGNVRILATGKVSLSGSSKVNDAGSPIAFRLFTSGTTFTLDGSARLKGFVYASGAAAAVKVAGSGVFVGGLYGGQLTVDGSVTLTRDVVYVPPADPLLVSITESGQPLAEGALFARAVTPVVTTTGGVAPVTVSTTLDGAAWTSGTVISANGEHTLAVAVTDSAVPPTKLSETRHFTVDTEGLSLSIVSPPPGAVVSTSPIVVTGTVSGATSLTLLGGQVVLQEGGVFSATVPLVEGTNPLRLVARDAAGNETSRDLPVVLDTLPPVVSLTSPSPGSCLAAGTTLTVVGRYIDAHPRRAGAPEGPAVSLTLTLPSGAATPIPASVEATGAFTGSFPIPEGTEGSATLLATATDALGNVSRVLSSLRLDSAAPEVSISSDGAPFPGSGTGAAPPPGAIPTFVNRALAARALVRDGAAAAPAATLTLDGQAYTEGTPIAVEGNHLLVARVTDCAGHESAAYAFFSVDTTAPALFATVPTENALLKEPVTTFSGTASADVATVTVGGQSVTPTPGADSTTFSLAPYSWREGANSVVVELVDRAGNRASFTRTFQVKTNGPVVEILLGGLPLGTGKTFFAPVTPEIRTNEPLSGSGAATLTTTLDGAPYALGTPIAAAGPHTLTASVVDAAGTPASAEASFTIDASGGPSVAITSPVDGQTLPGPTVDVSGTVSAAPSAGPATVRVNGRGAIVSVAGGTWTLAGLPLEPDAPNEIVAVAVDALGRSASAAVQVHVRSDGPKLVLLSPAEGTRTNRRRIDVVGAVVGGASSTADGLVHAGALSATIDATGSFRLLDVPLADGANTLSVTAVDAQGRTGETHVIVASDTTAPTVSFVVDGQSLDEGAAFAGPMTVTVSVSDEGGSLPAPRILLNGAAIPSAAETTEVPVPEAGGWVLSVVAVDGAGNETRASRSFVVGGGGCELSDVRPSAGSTTTEAKVTIVGRCGAARRVLVRVPQVEGGAPQEYTASVADGTFAAGDVPLPVVGENGLELVCEGASGAPSTVVHRITRLSGDGPVVSISTPAPGAVVTSSSATVSGAVSDATADLWVNGTKVGAAARTGTAFAQPGVALTEGPNVLVARAVDVAGRTAEARVVLQRDSQAPRLTVVWPTAGSRFGRRGDAPTVADVTGVVDLGSEPNLASVAVSSPAGSVVATVDPVTGAFRAPGLLLGDASGKVRVSVVATDSVGLTTTVPVDVEVDAAGPALRLDAPSDLARLTAASPPSIVVSGEAWASEGATVSVNGISLDPATLEWEPPAADGRRHVTFQTTIAAPTTDGPFGVIVRAEDLQKRSASTRRLLVRDTIAPSVSEVVPASGATGVDANGLVLVLFSEEVSRESLTAMNGFVVTREGQPEPIVGTFSVAGSAVAFVPGAALTPGATYRVVLGAGLSDLAGNPLEVPRESSFTVAPTLSGTSPALDTPLPAVVCAAALELKGSAPAGANLRVSVGAVTVNAVADASGRFVLSVPLLANGFHDVSLRIVGRDGSLGPALHGLVRKDCSAPFVERAALDREAGRVDVRFSERMDPATVTLSATAGDGASVVLSLEDEPAVARPGTLALDADGRSVRIDLPSDADAWWREKAVRLRVQEPAADENGIPVSAPWVTTFLPGGGAGDLTGGFLSGEVYDDATGRPLDGADVRLYPSTAAIPGAGGAPDPPLESTATDARGRYGFFGDVAAGRYAIHLGKTGYMPALRRLPLAPATGAVPFDARLTPLAPLAARRLDPAVGGSVEGPSGLLLEVGVPAFVEVPPETLGVRLTAISPQALPELLPLGWSPLAAADVTLEPEGATPVPLSQASAFVAGAVHLTLPLPTSVPPAASLVAVRHDVASGRWLTLGPVDRHAGAGDADVARVALVAPGAVAVVLADAEPAIAPPALSGAEGEPLTASALPSPVPPLTATLTLDPAVVSPTGRATARVVARSADGTTLWPSGLAVQAYLDEKLVLSGGGELYEAPFTADLLLTHHPLSPDEESGATTGTVGALSFSVSPSPKAAEVLLESGWENVRLFPFPESLERGSILGALGGTVTSPDGVELTLQEGALAESVSVEAKLLTAVELAGLPPPAGFDLLAAVRISFSGRTLARAATLSVPLPADAPGDAAGEARLLLAQLVEQPIDARGAFARLTARATRVAGLRALAAPEASGSPLPLEGLLSEGTYLVLRAQAPLGFATGFVRIGSGNGLALSRVTTPTLGTADLSRPGGRYAIPVPAGDNRDVSALHPQLDEAATGRIPSLAPSAVVALDLLVKPVGPHVVRVEPENGLTEQLIGSPLLVHFSEPIDPASVVPGLLTAELLSDDGAATGAFFNGTLTLQPGGATLVFQPTHPLPPGRRIRGRLTSGVRDVGGTPYEGALPYLWSFTTKKELNPGGQIDLMKIRLLLPENGTARIIGGAGAIPTGWSVSSSVENARPSPACPVTSTNVDTTGAFSIVAGCASTPVSLSSRVFLRALDSAGNITVLPLGPYVTADGLGFVVQPGEKAVYTTPEGVEVTVPARAFDEAKVVRVAKKDPATLGVPLPAYLELAAFIDVDFEGEARETLRLRIPVTTTAPVGTLVFAGAPIDLPWGRKLRLLDLARIVDGGGGAKVISNAEADQPVVGQQAMPPMTPGSLRALALPSSLLRTALLEFSRRSAAAFFHGQGVEMAAAVGHLEPAFVSASTAVLYNALADACVYAPIGSDWDGHYVLPAVVGSSLEVALRDVATGWILGQSPYDPAAGGANGVRDLGELPRPGSAGSPRPATLIEARPFDVVRFHALDTKGERRCERLRLELEACTENGTVEVRSVPGFALPEGGTLELSVGKASDDGHDAGGQSARASIVAGGAISGSLRVPASPADEVSLVVAPGDVDPDALALLRFDFDQALEDVPPAELECAAPASPCLVTLLDRGETDRSVSPGIRLPLRIEQSRDRSSILVEPGAVLPRGHAFTLELRFGSIQVRNATGKTPARFGYPDYAPWRFTFATRPLGDREIGSVGPGGSGLSLGDTNTARDIAKVGNLLLAGTATGRILAFDTSDITRLASPTSRPFALANLVSSDVRSLAADGHGRVFFTARLGGSWAVRALAIEAVRKASVGSCPSGERPAWAADVPCFDPVSGGARVAFALGTDANLTASEYVALTGALPSGIPSDLELLVSDETNPPNPDRPSTGTDSPKDLDVRSFYARYGAGDQLPASGPDGSYVLDLRLKSTHRRRPEVVFRNAADVCPAEKPWDHFQRVTVDNVTTGQTFSFDIHNEWDDDGSHGPGADPDGELTIGTDQGIRVRAGDRLRVRFNVRTFAYVSVVGGGISVVDLNRFYRTPSSEGSLAGASQCGRLLARESGASLSFPACPPGGGAAPDGLALTPSVAVADGGDDTAGVFSPLLHFGAVHSAHSARPAVDSGGGLPTPSFSALEQTCLRPSASALPGLGVTLRDVAVARDVKWTDRQGRYDSGWQFRVTAGAVVRDVRSDLVFYSAGPAGVFSFALESGPLGGSVPIGRYYRKDHPVSRLAVDPEGRFLLAGGYTAGSPSEPFIDIWDLSRVNGAPDSPGADGVDARLLGSIAAPWDAGHVLFDEAGTGLVYTWGADGIGGRAVPIQDPTFVFAGIYRPEKEPAEGEAFLPTTRVTTRFAPLGTPLRVSAADDADPAMRRDVERAATAAFRVRVSLPGNLGDQGELIAKVQALRALPERRNLGREEVGAAVGLPGGPGWPQNEVFVTLRRLGGTHATSGSDLGGGSGRLSLLFNEYESEEVVLLLSDPRAKKGYSRQPADPARSDSEERQCRRCDRPAHLQAMVDQGLLAEEDIRELLASGPYVRVLLSTTPLDPTAPGSTLPEAAKAATERVLGYFESLNAAGDVYRAPSGYVELFGWADEIPSPAQISLTEPALNRAEYGLEAGGSVLLGSGAARLVATDHVVRGRGLGFAADRSWRSDVLGFGPLGSAGFSSPLLAHLREMPALARLKDPEADDSRQELLSPGEVQYHDGEGNVFRFYPPCVVDPCPPGYVEPPVPSNAGDPPLTATKCPADYVADDNGSYCAPKGLYLRLEKRGAGWRLISREHDMAEFDEKGRLVVLSDRHRKGSTDPTVQGNSLQLFYDAFGQLSTIEDDIGRRYRLQYRDDPKPSGDGKRYGLLESLEDFALRSVEYEFHAEDRTLLKVRLPEVTNPSNGKSWVGASRPTLEYEYTAEPRGTGAPLNGADFAKVILTGFRAPHEPGQADPPLRLAFGYEATRGRVAEASVPPSKAGSDRPRWLFDWIAGSGSVPDEVVVTQPWGHAVRHLVTQGRVTEIKEDAEALGEADPTPAPGAAPPVRTLSTTFTFRDDGRRESITRPDGSMTKWEYDGGHSDRLARANVLEIREEAGTAPTGKAGYDEMATRLAYSVDVHSDNIAVEVTDGRLRVGRRAVAEAGRTDVPSGFPAAPDEKQPRAIEAKTDYDPFGRMKKHTGGPGLQNPHRFEVKYGKDARGREGAGFEEEISQGAIRETLEYDGGDKNSFRGNVTRRMTSFGPYSTASYDEWDRPIEERAGLSEAPGAYQPVDDVVVRRAFDAGGRLVSEIRRQSLSDVETRTEYNDRDQVVRVVSTRRAGAEPGAEPDIEAVAMYDYDAWGRLSTATSPAGVVTTYTYDSAGRRNGERTGDAGLRRTAFDPNGRVALVTDGDVGALRVRYDAWGQPWAEEHPSGAFVERVYDKAGGLLKESTFDKKDEATRKLLAETAANVTSFGAVNEVSELLTATPRAVRLTFRNHDEAGRLVSVTTGSSVAIQRTDLSVTYDDAGRPVDVTDAAGNRTNHVYGTEAPWPTATRRFETVPGLPAPVQTTTRTYKRDALGRIYEEDRGNGTIVHTFRDQAGNVTSTWSGFEAPTTWTYDGAGKVLSVSRPAGRGSTSYGYDRDGRLLARQSAGEGRVDRTSYLYEPLTGRLQSISHPDGTSQGYSYYPDDTVDVWTMRSGIQVRHDYDAANRLLARRILQVGGAGTPATDGGDTWTWDPLSRLLSAGRPSSSAQGVVYQEYDSAGRPREEVVGIRDPLTRGWDTWSREESVALPGGVGSHSATARDGYQRTFDGLDRVAALAGTNEPRLGASYTWGGTSRLYGQTSNGPLHTAHRHSFLGSGLGPQPEGTVAAPWRLGILSVGSAASPAGDTDAPSVVWGQLAFGYRALSGLKVGRKVLASPSLLSGQGWSWGLDAAQRLMKAEPGEGSLEGLEPSDPARFETAYGEGDEIRSLARTDSGEATRYEVGLEGRILSKDGVAFAYDAEGHRTSDDRYDYVWNYRGEIVSVTVKPCWPATSDPKAGEPAASCAAGQVRPLYAEHQTRIVRDALGRPFAEEHLGPPTTPGDPASRPFVGKKEFLWDGGSLLAEAGRAADGALLWRKSYVPGPSGIDDAVQLRVEIYDAAGARTSDRLFAYVRDEQGSVLALVEETATADPARPPIVLRNLYDPRGQAHAEVGPEIRSSSHDPLRRSVTLSDGTTVNQSVASSAAEGCLRVDLSVGIDSGTLAAGVVVERRLSDGTWGALTAADLALAHDDDGLLVLPLAGWERGTTYRVQLTSSLHDVLGRAPAGQPALEIPVPADGSPISWARTLPVSFETFLAAGETANGLLPGGQSILWQGAWTSSLGGHQLKRARVYDPRTASFLSEDPLDDVDSPNLYGYVAGRPHESTDPWGLSEDCSRAENPDSCRAFQAISSRLDGERAQLEATAPLP
ncbi:MAG: Ig-like domain-containing protein, partial [Thermoanaerobaculia bacterium]